VPFDDLSEILDPHLRLPIGGRTYLVPGVNAAIGLRLQALQAVAQQRRLSGSERESLQLGDDDELDLVRDCLGAAYQQMVDDDVPWDWIKHAGMTAFLRWTTGQEAAERFWRSPLGEAPGTPSPGRPRTSTTTAAAPSTRRPASTSGTRSRKKSSAATPRSRA